ncbi:MAG TPA: hypothetical protein PKC97_15390 [Burkholderiaceae bacterium]|nr:hypothetical protein [Burkholderiaceae bacterium]
MNPRWIAAIAIATLAGAALAQTVYETRDKNGPVFTDRPSAGASAVQLQAPNVIAMPPAPQAVPASGPALPAYRELVIDAPEAQGSIHSNTGAFDVRARLSPALRGSDRIQVSLDGNVLKARFRGPNLRVTEADWNAAANGDDALHTIQLTVVDAKGEPLIASAPVGFYMQRATVAKQRRAR